jgi:hypothetical protein
MSPKLKLKVSVPHRLTVILTGKVSQLASLNLVLTTIYACTRSSHVTLSFPQKNLARRSGVFVRTGLIYTSGWSGIQLWREFCYQCRMACKLNLISFSQHREHAFTKSGFTNWKHAIDSFKQHVKSSTHKEAVLKWSGYLSLRSIAQQLHSSRRSSCVEKH